MRIPIRSILTNGSPVCSSTCPSNYLRLQVIRSKCLQVIGKHPRRSPSFNLQGGADKSLARPGRKQATATKLGIYSTYSPRSSINFLARCSNFCKPLTKKFRKSSVQPGVRSSNDLRVGRKMATFQLFFSPGNRW